MATPMQIQRIAPMTMPEWQRQLILSTGAGLIASDGTTIKLTAQEIVTTSDQLRVWRGDGTYLGPVVDHGTVADSTAMAALIAASRGLHVGDRCYRSDEGRAYEVASGHGASAVWRAVGAGTGAAASAVWGAISGTLTEQADLATALAGKAAVSHTHTRSQISDASTAGRALLAVANPAEPAVPVVAADGSVSLTPSSSLGGGGGSGSTELLYSESFSDLSAWAIVNGSWSVSGGVLSKTSSGIADIRLDLAALRLLGECVVRVEVGLSGAPAANTYCGVLTHWGGSTSVSDTAFSRLYCAPGTLTPADVSIDRTITELLATRTLSGYLTSVPSLGDWVEISVRISGGMISAWIGATHCCSARLPTTVGQPRYLGLRVGDAGAGAVQFRNLRVYGPGSALA